LGPANPNDFFDKDALAAAKDGSGLVVVSLTNFKQVCAAAASGLGEITISRSSDGGDTYEGPVVVAPGLPHAGGQTRVSQQGLGRSEDGLSSPSIVPSVRWGRRPWCRARPGHLQERPASARIWSPHKRSSAFQMIRARPGAPRSRSRRSFRLRESSAGGR